MATPTNEELSRLAAAYGLTAVYKKGLDDGRAMKPIRWGITQFENGQHYGFYACAPAQKGATVRR